MTPIRLLVALTLALYIARPSHAQSDRSGCIEGTVTDSIHARPLAGVRVVALGVQSPDVMRGYATSTPTGTLRIDSLPPGRLHGGLREPVARFARGHACAA